MRNIQIHIAAHFLNSITVFKIIFFTYINYNILVLLLFLISELCYTLYSIVLFLVFIITFGLFALHQLTHNKTHKQYELRAPPQQFEVIAFYTLVDFQWKFLGNLFDQLLGRLSESTNPIKLSMPLLIFNK